MAAINGGPVGPPPAAHVQLVRNPDGRHAVLDATGNVLGLHNSLASAQRHMADYYEPQGSQGVVPPNTFQPPTPAPMGGGFQAPNLPQRDMGAPPLAMQETAFQHGLSQPVNEGHVAPQAPAGPPVSPLAAGMAMGQMYMAGHPNATPAQLSQAANALRAVQAGMQTPAMKPGVTAGVQQKMQAQHEAQRQAAAQVQRGQGTPQRAIHGS